MAHKTSLTLSLFIEAFVPSQESERSFVRSIHFASFYDFFYWTLEPFRQCGILSFYLLIVLYNYCTWTRSIWDFMEQSTTILNEALRLVQYCCTLLHKTSYWSSSSVVIVLLHMILENFEILWNFWIFLKFRKCFENFKIVKFFEIFEIWFFFLILKFYERNFEIFWKFRIFDL